MQTKLCYFKKSLYILNPLSYCLYRFTFYRNAVIFTFTQFKIIDTSEKKQIFLFLKIYFQKNNFYQNTEELDKLLQQSNKEKLVLERQLALKYSQVIPNQGDFSNNNNPNKQQLNTIKVL